MKENKFHAARVAAAWRELRRQPPPIKGKNTEPIPAEPKRLTAHPVPSMGRDRKTLAEIIGGRKGK